MREEKRPPLTWNTYAQSVRLFLRDHNHDIPSREWKRLRKRGFLPKRSRAITRDVAPSRDQLRTILNHLDVRGRALVLFLASSGARINEALQLKISNLKLKEDPPSAFLEGESTKGGARATCRVPL
jgi:integrase